MGYSEKFEIVKNNIIRDSKQRITDNWDGAIDMWLRYEADWEFPDIYKKAFNHEFAQYMNPEIETLLWLSAKNIVFAIVTYMSVKGNTNLDDILKFTKRFIEEQLDDFDNWCDHIGTAMYEESSEYERENARLNNLVNSNRQAEQEDNPQ